MRAAVIGGTGMVGLGVVRALAAARHDVTVLHRGETRAELPDGVDVLRVDRAEPGALAAAIAGTRPDAVVDLCCYDADEAAVTVEACRGVPRVLVVSTVNVYGGRVPVPLRTGSPLNPVSDYGRDKVAAEDVFRAAWARGDSDATLVRLGAVYRTGCYLDGQLAEDAYWMRHLAAGLPAVVMDDGARAWNVLHADDAGRAMTALLENDAAGRTEVLVGSRQPLTWRGYYETAYRGLGRDFSCVSLPSEWLRDRWDMGFPEEMSLWDQVYDLGTLEALAPGYEERVDLARGLPDAVGWWIANGDLGDEEIADRAAALVAEWQATSGQ